ncbi:MAG: hypothetical protein U0894_02215 [Pirellulales bacterium]
MLEDVGGGGSGSGMAGGERDLEEPHRKNSRSVIERNPETTLESIALVVKNEQVALESVGGESSFGGNGEGAGSGDGRGVGPGGPGTSDGIPAWERWEARFTATNLNAYAAQLDFFGVELGVAGVGESCGAVRDPDVVLKADGANGGSQRRKASTLHVP